MADTKETITNWNIGPESEAISEYTKKQMQFDAIIAARKRKEREEQRIPKGYRSPRVKGVVRAVRKDETT